MHHFKSKLVGKCREREKIKIFNPFRPVSNLRIIENSKNIAKKLKKLNNIIMASFQAKIGWKTQRKRENKNCHFLSFRSYPTRNRKFQKNLKTEQYPIIASFQAKINWKWSRNRKNVNYRSAPFLHEA